MPEARLALTLLLAIPSNRLETGPEDCVPFLPLEGHGPVGSPWVWAPC